MLIAVGTVRAGWAPLRLPHRSTFLAHDPVLRPLVVRGAIVYIQIAPFLVEKGFTGIGRIARRLSDRIGSVWSYRAAVSTAPPPSVSRSTKGNRDRRDRRPAGGIGGVSAELIASVDLFGTRAAGP